MLDVSTSQPSTTTDSSQLVHLLRHSTRGLDSDLRGQILSAGSGIIPALLETLQDEYLLYANAEDGGWAPVHAAKLLVELEVEKSIAPMLKVLGKIDTSDAMGQTLEESLIAFGDCILEPTLQAYADTNDDDYRDCLCTVLAQLGIQDDRIFFSLVEALDRNADLGAMSLADYGDPRAIEYLSRAFDDYEINTSHGGFANHTPIELKAALVMLGGSLSSAQQRKYRRSQEPTDRWRRELSAALENPAKHEVCGKKIGQNEPCWCGSEKKYKKCHLRSDEAERQ